MSKQASLHKNSKNLFGTQVHFDFKVNSGFFQQTQNEDELKTLT
jgi:hypothetical protein